MGVPALVSDQCGAAEVLREQREAVVFGRKSAGMVLVSMLAPLPNGFQLQYPVTDFITAQGIRLEGRGVTPDFETDDPKFPRAGVEDPSITRAVAVMHRYKTRDGASR